MQKLIRVDCDGASTNHGRIARSRMLLILMVAPLPIIMSSNDLLLFANWTAPHFKTHSTCDANAFTIINDSIWFWCDVAACTTTVTRKLQCRLRIWSSSFSGSQSRQASSEWMNEWVEGWVRLDVYLPRANCFDLKILVNLGDEQKLWFAHRTDWGLTYSGQRQRVIMSWRYNRNGIRISDVNAVLLNANWWCTKFEKKSPDRNEEVEKGANVANFAVFSLDFRHEECSGFCSKMGKMCPA